jgi:hypothetical protein
MRFPATFTRYKTGGPAGSIVLGADGLLVDGAGNPRKPADTDDNVLSSRIVSINGWPLERIVVVGKFTPAADGQVAAALPIAVYAFEDSLGMWFPITGSATAITPGTITTPLAPVFFDAMSLIDFPHAKADLGATQPGAADFLVVIGDNTSGNGRYDFAIGAEMTSKPF